MTDIAPAFFRNSDPATFSPLSAPALPDADGALGAPRPKLFLIDTDPSAAPVAEPIGFVPPTLTIVPPRPDDAPLLQTSGGRAEWITDDLIKPGAIFDGKVHIPAVKGRKTKVSGEVTPITLSALRAIVALTLREAPRVETHCFPTGLVEDAAAQGTDSLAHAQLEQGARLMSRLISHYWIAVSRAFPEAWDDRHGHVLWQGFGLTAFSRFGGRVIQQRVDEREIRQEYFDDALRTVAASVALDAESNAGLATAAGAKHLYERLVEAGSGGGFTELTDSLAEGFDWGRAASAPSPLPFG